MLFLLELISIDLLFNTNSRSHSILKVQRVRCSSEARKSTFLEFFIVKYESQHLERQNVERPIFRNFEISNIKINNVELFNFFYFRIYFYFYIFEIIPTFKIYDNL